MVGRRWFGWSIDMGEVQKVFWGFIFYTVRYCCVQICDLHGSQPPTHSANMFSCICPFIRVTFLNVTEQNIQEITARLMLGRSRFHGFEGYAVTLQVLPYA